MNYIKLGPKKRKTSHDWITWFPIWVIPVELWQNHILAYLPCIYDLFAFMMTCKHSYALGNYVGLQRMLREKSTFLDCALSEIMRALYSPIPDDFRYIRRIIRSNHDAITGFNLMVKIKKIKRLPTNIDKWLLDTLCCAMKRVPIEEMLHWGEPGNDAHDFMKIIMACAFGHVPLYDFMHRILEADGRIHVFLNAIRFPRCLGLRLACKNGHSSIVSRILLVKGVDPSIKDQDCIRSAILYGRLEVVRILMQHPSVIIPDECIAIASKNGYDRLHALLLYSNKVKLLPSAVSPMHLPPLPQ